MSVRGSSRDTFYGNPKMIGVIGNTGQGKTSLLKALHASQGSKNSRLVTNTFRPPIGVTVKQYLLCGAKMRPYTRRSHGREHSQLMRPQNVDNQRRTSLYMRVNTLLKYFELQECADFLLTSQNSKLTVSHGQRARAHLAFIIASVHRSLDYLLLDEPLSPLDLNTAIDLGRVLSNMVNGSKDFEDILRIQTIILTVHQPPATIWRLLDHVIIVHNLTVIFAGPRSHAEYFLLTNYSQCSREPDFIDPATRIYAVIDDLDQQTSDMSWVKSHDAQLIKDLREPDFIGPRYVGEAKWTGWLRRQSALIILTSRTMWLASKMLTLLFGPIAFLSHGVVLGLLLRKNYESSVEYGAISDSLTYNKIDTIPLTVFELPSFKAFERIWPTTPRTGDGPDDTSPFNDYISRLSASEIEDDPDFSRWPLSMSAVVQNQTSKTNPIEEFMRLGPKGNGRIDIFDALIFKKPTLKFIHKLIWCVRDNIDLYQQQLKLPDYSPKYPEWLLPLSRDQGWRNNVYEASAIPDSLPTLSPENGSLKFSNKAQIDDDELAQTCLAADDSPPNDQNQIDWDSENWDHLTAALLSSEISTFLQMIEVGSNDWDWQGFRACHPTDGAFWFYNCLRAAYPTRVQSVLRCAGLPQIPSYLMEQLPIPDPPFVPHSENSESASRNSTNISHGASATARQKMRRLFLEYDEHWSFFVGLRHMLHSINLDWLYRLLIRLVQGVILSLMAGVCMYFLIISSGFFCMQALSQWANLRSLGAEYRLNGIIPHAYEFILAFNFATWPQTLWLSLWLCMSYIIASGLPWSLIPWAILTLTLYIQVLVGYTLVVCELTSSLQNHANDATARIITFVLVALVELSGFFIRPSNYPSHTYWLTCVSPYKWATELMNLKYARPNEYTVVTHVPHEIVLAILGNVDRSVALCINALVALYLVSLGCATTLYTIRIAANERKSIFSNLMTKSISSVEVTEKKTCDEVGI